MSRASGDHAPRFGINFIHEPVLSGALSGTAETLLAYTNNPDFYAANPSQFYFNLNCVNPPADVTCSQTPAGNGSFSQNVQRLGLYAEDSWRATAHLTINYGLRYDTTFGLLTASGRSQAFNPAYLTLKALGIPLVNGVAHDYRKAFGPRIGIAYSPGQSGTTVIRAGFGLFYNDLAQNGWVTAFQAVNEPAGCMRQSRRSGLHSRAAEPGNIIDPNYKTPYAIHATAGIQHAFNANWTLERGLHPRRRKSRLPCLSLRRRHFAVFSRSRQPGPSCPTSTFSNPTIAPATTL